MIAKSNSVETDQYPDNKLSKSFRDSGNHHRPSNAIIKSHPWICLQIETFKWMKSMNIVNHSFYLRQPTHLYYSHQYNRGWCVDNWLQAQCHWDKKVLSKANISTNFIRHYRWSMCNLHHLCHQSLGLGKSILAIRLYPKTIYLLLYHMQGLWVHFIRLPVPIWTIQYLWINLIEKN